jgi:hypothetical protein
MFASLKKNSLNGFGVPSIRFESAIRDEMIEAGVLAPASFGIGFD